MHHGERVQSIPKDQKNKELTGSKSHEKSSWNNAAVSTLDVYQQMSGERLPTLSTTDRARQVIRVRAEDDDSTVRDKDGNAEVDEDGVKDAKADSDKDEASEVDDERDVSAEQTELDEEADDKDQDEDREALCGPSKLAEE